MARRLAVLLAVLMSLVLVGCGSSGSDAPVKGFSTSDKDGYHGAFLDEPYAVPGVALTDTDGKPFDLAAQDKRTLVFFGYTNCPDICQVVMSTIASAVAKLSASQRDQVQVAFVTTDPARDTRAAMRTYLDRFNPTFEGATGRLPAIVRLARALAVPVEKGRRLASGGYDVSHGTQVLGLVPDGRAPFVWTEGTGPGALADDISTILADKVAGL